MTFSNLSVKITFFTLSKKVKQELYLASCIILLALVISITVSTLTVASTVTNREYIIFFTSILLAIIPVICCIANCIGDTRVPRDSKDRSVFITHLVAITVVIANIAMAYVTISRNELLPTLIALALVVISMIFTVKHRQ